MRGALLGPARPARRIATSTSALAAAAACGAAYAWSAYALDPIALPIAVAGAAAVMIGLWRLEWGLALLLLLTPVSENTELSDPGHAKLRFALIGWTGLLVLVELGRLARSGDRLRTPAIGWAAVAFLAAGLVSIIVAVNDSVAAGKLLMLCGSVIVFGLVAFSIDSWARLEVVLAGAIVAGL
ncbi:MAG: hypothetical protein QOF55_960, partial [Thermoleophilaceae bacterium]|nr:hypothetical protein [Thermoleophilaceae bacterium]